MKTAFIGPRILLLWAAAICLPVAGAIAAAVNDEPMAGKATVATQKAPADDQPDVGPSPGAADDLEEGPRGRGWGPRRAGHMLWQRLDDDEKNAMKAFMLDHFPKLYGEFLPLEESAPDAFNRKIGRVLPLMMQLRDLSSRDPELFEVKVAETTNEMELRDLARRHIRATDDKETEELEKTIRLLVEKQFDLRLRRMKLEVSRLEARLDGLRNHIVQMDKDRTTEIDLSLERILRDGMPGPGRHRGLGGGPFGEGDGPPPPPPQEDEAEEE